MRGTRAHLMVCVLAMASGWLPVAVDAPETLAAAEFPGWTQVLESIPLKAPKQVELTEVDFRFAEAQVGQIARFEAEGRQVLVRWLPQSTHRIHGARHCYLGRGYQIHPQSPNVAFDSGEWGRFIAQRGSEQHQVYERIVDGAGKVHSDVSAWYWSAALGRSRGPWLSILIVERSATPFVERHPSAMGLVGDFD